MIITTYKIDEILDYFNNSSFDYLLFFVGRFSQGENEIINQLIKDRTRIDAITGNNILFTLFAETIPDNPNIPDKTDLRRCISNIREITTNKYIINDNFHNDVVESSLAVSDEICNKFNVRLSQLPAFILIERISINTQLYSIKNNYDIEIFLEALNFIRIAKDEIRHLHSKQDKIKLLKTPIIEESYINENIPIESKPKYLKIDRDNVQKEIEILTGILEITKNHKVYSQKAFYLYYRDCLSSYIHDKGIVLTKKMYEFIAQGNSDGIMNTIEEGEYEIDEKSILFIKRKCRKIEKRYLYKKQQEEFNNFSCQKKLIKLKNILNDKDSIHKPSKTKIVQRKIKVEIPRNEDLRIAELKKECDEIPKRLETQLSFELTIELSIARNIINRLLSGNSCISEIISELNTKKVQHYVINDITLKDDNNYEVFISAKSEDYSLAQRVSSFIAKNSYRVFFADKSLREEGSSDYGRIISRAIDSCSNLIVVSSSINYIYSSYVDKEWRLFYEEMRTGRKKGNLMCVLTDVINIDELPIELRNTQNFCFKDYKPDILDFLIRDS